MALAVILDVDGTLVLMMPMPKPGLTHLEFSYDVIWQVRPLIGMGGDQVIPKLVPTYEG